MVSAGIRDQESGVSDRRSGVRRQFGKWRLIPGSCRLTPVHWLLGRTGDMVWNALVIVTVLLPLSGLAIDVPRYFALRSRLQIAADAGAEAAARTVDIRHYINTGETRLEPDRYAGDAAWAFETAVADLRARGYTATLDGVDLDEAADAVSTRASGTIRLFYNLTPPVTVRVGATSWYRMIQR